MVQTIQNRIYMHCEDKVNVRKLFINEIFSLIMNKINVQSLKCLFSIVDCTS